MSLNEDDASERTPAEPSERKPMVKMTPVQKRKVYQLLDEHLDCEERVYRDGWNDEKIGEAAGAPKDHVRYIRSRAYCLLKPTGRPPINGGSAQKLAALEDRVMTAMKNEIAAVLDLIAKAGSEPASGGNGQLVGRVEALERDFKTVRGQVAQLLMRRT